MKESKVEGAGLRGALATAAFALFASMLFADTTTVDDLSGLRPDTDGVETNAFWDTRLHSSYTVQKSSGTSTNSFNTAVATFDYSNLGNPGMMSGLHLIIR